jgi:hypothetical protein
MNNKQLLDLYVELYKQGDLDGIIDLYADDAVQWMPDGVFEGRNSIRERLARELAAFSDIDWGVTSFVEQDDAFADEWWFTGTHTGPLQRPDGTELPPTGGGSKCRAWSSSRCATKRSSSTTSTTTT